MPTVIDHPIEVRLITRSDIVRALPATLRYDAADAHAVQVLFPATASLDGSDVIWVFSRDLLDTGLHAPAGEGDVRLWPHGHGRTRLALHAAEGTALVELESADVRRFLCAAYARVPRGEESPSGQLDRGLDELLRGV